MIFNLMMMVISILQYRKIKCLIKLKCKIKLKEHLQEMKFHNRILSCCQTSLLRIKDLEASPANTKDIVLALSDITRNSPISCQQSSAILLSWAKVRHLILICYRRLRLLAAEEASPINKEQLKTFNTTSKNIWLSNMMEPLTNSETQWGWGSHRWSISRRPEILV